MIQELMTDSRTAIVLAFLIVVCCIPFAGANANGENVSITETTSIPMGTELSQSPTLLETIIPTLTAIISPMPTTTVETKPVETIPAEPADSPVTTRTPGNQTQPEVNSTPVPVLQRKTISPSVQRKISTNLLYLIDADTPGTGLSRDAVRQQMQAEGKIKVGKQAAGPEKKAGQASKAPEEEPDTNLVLVYIDLVPTAPTSAVDAYVSSVTERNEQGHSVVAWVDINKLDSLASLDAVSNVRTAEPSVTKESPVYHDTKFVNKRAGLPPLTVDEAKVSVREFEDSPGMALEQKRTMSTPRGEVYEMASDSGRYFVNAKTGEVELASFYGKQGASGQSFFMSKPVASPPQPDSGTVTMDQAFVIAQDYARKNYRNFHDRTMVLIESKLVDHGDSGKTFYFTWKEKINDVLLPNIIFITVTSENGEILNYMGVDQSLDINLEPSVSEDVALTIARTQFAPLEIVRTNLQLAFLPVNENEQRLVWLVNVICIQDGFIHQGGEVFVDANTGEIITVNSFS